MATLVTFVDGTILTAADLNTNFSNLNSESRGVSTGGTGAASFTDHGFIFGSGTSALTASAAPTNGQLPIGSTGTDPVIAALTAGQSINITNGAGSITIATQASDQALFWMGA